MEILDDPQKVHLVQRLEKGTRADRYLWQAVDDSEYSFKLDTGKFRFELASRDRDDLAPYVLTISRLNPFSGDARIIQMVETEPDVWDLNSSLEELYQVAKRKVLRLDKLAEELFDELDELDDDEPPF